MKCVLQMSMYLLINTPSWPQSVAKKKDRSWSPRHVGYHFTVLRDSDRRLAYPVSVTVERIRVLECFVIAAYWLERVM